MNLNSRMCKKPIKVTQLIDEDRSSLQLLFVNLPQKMKRVLCQDAQSGTFLPIKLPQTTKYPNDGMTGRQVHSDSFLLKEIHPQEPTQTETVDDFRATMGVISIYE